MRLFLLGATGRTGAQILDVALARGHQVTAYVRSPHKLPRADVAVVRGDPLRTDDLARAMAGHDAVISALGLPAREALRPSNRMAEFAAATIAAMQTAQVRRLAIVSAAVLFPLTGPSASFFRWFLRHHARDLAAMEAVVEASPFEWTIARPGRLVASPAEAYRSQRAAFPRGKLSMSTRAVAAFLVDAVEQRSHCGEIVGLAAA
jgi:putative NADH-flavin reductase